MDAIYEIRCLLYTEKDTAQDVLHTEYGMLNNSVYILGKIRQYEPFLPWLMLLGIFVGSLMQHLWTFIGKFVFDYAKDIRIFDIVSKGAVYAIRIYSVMDTNMSIGNDCKGRNLR